MRILHLASHAGLEGGGAVQMARMATGLKARGHHVVCGFNQRGSSSGASGHEAGFMPLQAAGVPCLTLRMGMLFERLLGARRRLRAIIAEHGFDIIHAHKPRALRFALSALDGMVGGGSRPVVVAQRGNSDLLDEHTRRLFNDRKVRAIVCVAEQVRETVIAGGIAADKVVTIYGGVNPDEFDANLDGAPARREFGIAPDAPVVGIVANFDGKKAHDDFFMAAVLVLQRVPAAHFLVVGRGAPSDLPSRLQLMGLGGHVTLTGFRADVPRLLAAMDVSVNCSDRGEGLTGAMRESLCMKKAVVCTDVGGNRELVRDGETGRLVPPGDIPAVAEAVLDLLSDSRHAQRMAEAGYQLVMRDFTETVRIERLERLYYDIAHL